MTADSERFVKVYFSDEPDIPFPNGKSLKDFLPRLKNSTRYDRRRSGELFGENRLMALYETGNAR